MRIDLIIASQKPPPRGQQDQLDPQEIPPTPNFSKAQWVLCRTLIFMFAFHIYPTKTYWMDSHHSIQSCRNKRLIIMRLFTSGGRWLLSVCQSALHHFLQRQGFQTGLTPMLASGHYGKLRRSPMQGVLYLRQGQMVLYSMASNKLSSSHAAMLAYAQSCCALWRTCGLRHLGF